MDIPEKGYVRMFRSEVIMKRWEQLLEDGKRSLEDLKDRLNLTEEEAAAFQLVEEHYPIVIPEGYLRLISPWDADDPIKRMCIPLATKPSDDVKYITDTVIDGGQHKYDQSVLIMTNFDCLTYARRCYRKDFVALSPDEVTTRIPKLAEYIGDHPEIDNISISGGDAFLNSNQRIGEYLKAFSFLPNIDYIRFTTSTPATLPERITEDDGELLGLLSRYAKAKAIVIVTQFDHPRELTDKAVVALRMLREAGCTIRNEAVLMKGVNDEPDAILELMNGLVAAGVDPYYLYQCRRPFYVQDNLQVPIADGIRIVESAKERMSGMSKSFRFILAHRWGKVEMLGFLEDGRAVFKYHEARKDEDQGRIFATELAEGQTWLD